MSELSSFSPFDIETSTDPTVIIHGVKAGTGPPLLLLHGYPQNHLIWHDVAPTLSSRYTVVALDLRGYGSSSKPPGGDDHSTYSKSNMARDCIDVMSKLNLSPFYLCAHDRGARVAHKLCVDHPLHVKKLIMLDIAPTAAMYSSTNFEFAKLYFHWFFLIQAFPLPEHLISSNVDAFMDGQVGRHVGAEIFGNEYFKAYRNMMRDPAVVHASCEDYRASASIDLEENKEDEKLGRKVKCPVLVLWGEKGVIEKCFDAVQEWEKVCEGSVEGESLSCGHYIPEELPEQLLERVERFFAD